VTDQDEQVGDVRFLLRRIMVEQERYIRARFGAETAERSNYGWVLDEEFGRVATRVHGRGVLTTLALTGGRFHHEFRRGDAA